MTKPTEGQMACPDCKKSIPVYDGVRNWCDGCGWNIAGEPPKREDSFLARQYDRLGRRYGKSLLHRLKELPPERLRPRWSSRMAFAATMASVVHLLSLALVAFGFVLIITGYPNVMKILLGIGACLFGWLMWPSPISRPQKDIIDRNAYPALFALVDEVTDALGGQRINHIVIDEAFNASYALADWRRVPVLTIGLPLWITLGNKERVAVLAHEVAHGVNGDVTRSFLVGSALRSLDEWIYLLQGVGHHARSGPEALAGYLTWILSLPFALYQSLLTQLLWLDKQQAEYFADYLASTVSGTDASIGALRRLSSSEHLHDVLLKSAFSNSQSGSYILQRYSEHIYTLPGREWQRLARAAEQEHARLDASHPPTAHRIEFLRAHPRIEQMTVSDKRMKTIDSELQSLHDKLGGRLIAQYARD